LATAVGYKACEMGKEVRFYRVSDLVANLEKAWKEDKLVFFKSKFRNVDLIILDEMGYVPFNTEGAELFFQLISDWYEQKSLIITSNLEFSQWNRIFGDSRLTAALVDCVIHHAHSLFSFNNFRPLYILLNLLYEYAKLGQPIGDGVNKSYVMQTGLLVRGSATTSASI